MKLKDDITEYTEKQFEHFVQAIIDVNVPDGYDHDDMVLLFDKITEHPDGTDLIYYPKKNADNSAKGITKEVKEWRAKNGKPGFKEL